MRSQVYEYIRGQMRNGNLSPGALININEIIRTLGISRTPLREALLQLETEGFVKFLPHRGIMIAALTRKELENICEIIGALESHVIITVFNRIGQAEIDKMKRYNKKMKESLSTGKFNHVLDTNLNFHNVFLNLSNNETLVSYVNMLKQRLYDFHTFPKSEFVKKWVKKNSTEHEQFINFVEAGNAKRAADFIRDVHWFLQHPEWHLSNSSSTEEGISSLKKAVRHF